MINYESSIRFLVKEHDKTIMKCNDFTAVYFKKDLTYNDVVRLCFKIGSIPGDVIIKELLNKSIKIIKRVG